MAVPFSTCTSETPIPKGQGVRPFELDETTISSLQDAMKSGRMTSHTITEKYLARIEELDRKGPSLHAVIEVNPDALSMARDLDRERKAKGPRGPLHGIPVLVKDNVGTADRMTTTAGSCALEGSIPARDSFVAAQLRKAGAVILGKANLSEWANFRSSHSTSGWSGRGGQARNPYALDRNPCGSSSGSGVAVSANLCPVALGTETDGSIVCPSSTNGIVGIKPTVGLASRSGVVPISHTQDTAGPMARTVADAAAVLGAIAGVDPRDDATLASRGKSQTDYTKFLDSRGLKGARIGVVRQLFGYNEFVDKLADAAIAAMKGQGAVIVDPANIETFKHLGDGEFTVLLYEFKAGLNAYLASLGPKAPVHTLKEIIDFNEKHAREELPYFGQDTFIKAEAKGSLSSPEYRKALAKCRELSREKGIDATMEKYRLDALVAPTGAPAWPTDLVNGDHDAGGSSGPAAIAGYPHVTVPAGYVFGLPVGISFFGCAWSEPTLIKLAYSFEQATKFRKPPRFLPTADLRV
ncbi:MAG TPA: amidase [Terriglobia bacterium]|nr:amidase [Terriglobia bacterium]HKT12898.1 amidase [Terriglobia bacterium]